MTETRVIAETEGCIKSELTDMAAHWGKKMYRKGGKLIMYCSIELQF